MKEKTANRKLSVIVIICILAVALAAVHFARAASDEIPKLDLSKSVNQSSSAGLLHLDALELPAEDASAVYKMKAGDEKQNKADILKALSLEDRSKFGSIPYPDSAYPSGSLGYDKYSGRWIYQTDIAYYTGENVPTKEQAVQIADEFVRSLNLYPADKLGEPTVHPMTGNIGQNPQAILRWDVYYFPQVDNKPIYGVYRICVSVGSDGKIVSVEKLANDFEKIADVPLAGIEEVRKRVEKGDFMYMNSGILQQDTDLTKAEIGYYTDVESEYILPIYILTSADDAVSIMVDAQSTK